MIWLSVLIALLPLAIYGAALKRIVQRLQQER
jgi:hypothetical protein